MIIKENENRIRIRLPAKNQLSTRAVKSLDDIVGIYRGKPGIDGIGIKDITQPSLETIEILLSNGDLKTIAVPRGRDGKSIQGDKGDKGDSTIGPQGARGPAGKAGKDGVGIESITQPEESVAKINYTDGTHDLIDLPRGKDGREIELGFTQTHLRWRYVGEKNWKNLFSILEFQRHSEGAGTLKLVQTLNGLLGNVTISAGANVSLNIVGNDIEISATGSGGGGDVTGPASATNNEIAIYNGITGKIIKTSGAFVDGSGNLTATNFSGSSSGANTGDQDLSPYALIASLALVAFSGDYNDLINTPTIITDHGALTGLADDDHLQYALLAGRAGGQSLIGGINSGDDLHLVTTSNITKGTYFLDDLTTDGLVRTSGGNGALSIDTNNYLTETAADAFYIRLDGTTPTTAEIPFDFGLTSLYGNFELGVGLGTDPTNNKIEQTVVDRNILFTIDGAQAFKLDIVSGHESNFDIIFPANVGIKSGSLTLPTAHTYGDGTDYIINSRLLGTGATVLPHNLKVAQSSDVFSIFGVSTGTAFSPTDTTDMLIAWKTGTDTAAGAKRSGLFVSEFQGVGSDSSARWLGVNGAGVTSAASTANLLATSQGGGLVGGRYIFNHLGSGTAAMASGISIQGIGKTVTDASALNLEVPSITAGSIWAEYHHTAYRFGSTGTRITLGFGILMEAIPAAFATTSYQIGLDGVGTRSGLYLNTPTRAGLEFIRSASTGNITVNGGTSANVNGGTTVNLDVAGTTIISCSSTVTDISITDNHSFTLGTANGTKWGLATNQKQAWWNATPIIQPINTTALDTLLVNVGFRASGGVANFATTIKPRTGGTAAGSEPLQFTSASLLSSATAGTMEFLTDKAYITIATGTARKEFTLNDGTLTSGRVPFATTNGRLTDDADLTFATDTLTATKMVGTTSVKVGTAGGFISSDGSTGFTGTGTYITFTFKDGIVTAAI